MSIPVTYDEDVSEVERSAELVGRLGVHRGAKKLIEAHADMRQPDVVAAQLRGVNYPLTKRLDHDALADKLGHPIIGAKVYGSAPEDVDVIFQIQGASGRTARRCASLKSLGGEKVLRDAEEVAVEAMADTGNLAMVVAQLRAEVADMRLRTGNEGTGPRMREVDDPALAEAQAHIAELEARLADQESAPPTEAGAASPAPAATPPKVESLPFEDYDDLNAKDIIDRLTGSAPDEKAEVLAYEQANQNRKTVVEAADGDWSE